MSHDINLSINEADELYKLRGYLDTKLEDEEFRDFGGEHCLELQRWVDTLAAIEVRLVHDGWHPRPADDSS